MLVSGSPGVSDSKVRCDRVYQINRPVRFEFNHPNRCEIEKLKQFLHRCCWSGDHVLNAFNDQEHALMTRLVQQPEAYRSGPHAEREYVIDAYVECRFRLKPMGYQIVVGAGSDV